MAIVGIGTDIVNVPRIEKLLARSPEFAQRVLHAVELEQLAQRSNQAAFVAKRFAVKEAAAKALGCGIGAVSFRHIYVTYTDSGQPLLRFTEQGARQASELGVTHSHVSISDEKDFAIAYVVLEAN
jgi:holo-[acyl-carrier protein] synthase